MTLITGSLEWILSISIMASVLVVFILAIRWLLKNKLQPRWMYYLWLLLLLRLVLPWTPESPISFYNMVNVGSDWGSLTDLAIDSTNGNPVVDFNLERGTTMLGNSSQDNTVQIDSDHNNPVSSKVEGKQTVEGSAGEASKLWWNNISLLSVLSCTWLLVALVVLNVMVVANIKFIRKMKKEQVITEQSMIAIFEQCKRQMNLRQNITLIQSNQITSLALYGIIQPKLFMPVSVLNKLSADRLKYIFLHELSHVKRNDIAVNGMMSIMVALHWFNPLIWFACRKMRDDQEMACDALDAGAWNDEVGFGSIVNYEVSDNQIMAIVPGAVSPAEFAVTAFVKYDSDLKIKNIKLTDLMAT